MKFLAKENIPLGSISILRAAGYEIVCISEIMSGARDKDVIQYAVQNNLIILTFDRDYGELIFRFGQQLSSGVVYFRLSQVAPEDCGNLLVQQIQRENLQLETFFTVIEKDGIRQRKLPSLM
jgi:predicted nuclease of predicted toxin-antitoxin system